jgi:protein-tyrosine-phosphatase
MAEALFRALVKERGELGEWWIESAGVGAIEGEPATENTKQVASERGMDLRTHRSKPATWATLKPFSLVLVMEENHRRQLREAAPELADRVYMMSEMVGLGSDVRDPIGREIEKYRAMADEIDGMLRTGFDRIGELADYPPSPPAEDRARSPTSE